MSKKMKKSPEEKIEYFRQKLEKANSEIESKSQISINFDELEKKIEGLGGIEVFRGKIISNYYKVLGTEAGLNFISSLFDLERTKLIYGTGGAFARLREMYDVDGTEIYMVETRIKDLKLNERTKLVHEDPGYLTDARNYRYLKILFKDNKALEFRQKEVKKRTSYILEEIKNLEYSLDQIINPVQLKPYLEIEVSGRNLINNYLEAVNKIGMNPKDFREISARVLIEEHLRNFDEVTKPMEIIPSLKKEEESVSETKVKVETSTTIDSKKEETSQ